VPSQVASRVTVYALVPLPGVNTAGRPDPEVGDGGFPETVVIFQVYDALHLSAGVQPMLEFTAIVGLEGLTASLKLSPHLVDEFCWTFCGSVHDTVTALHLFVQSHLVTVPLVTFRYIVQLRHIVPSQVASRVTAYALVPLPGVNTAGRPDPEVGDGGFPDTVVIFQVYDALQVSAGVQPMLAFTAIVGLEGLTAIPKLPPHLADESCWTFCGSVHDTDTGLHTFVQSHLVTVPLVTFRYIVQLRHIVPSQVASRVTAYALVPLPGVNTAGRPDPEVGDGGFPETVVIFQVYDALHLSAGVQPMLAFTAIVGLEGLTAISKLPPHLADDCFWTFCGSVHDTDTGLHTFVQLHLVTVPLQAQRYIEQFRGQGLGTPSPHPPVKSTL